jgi:hypothetical protein
LLKKLAQRNDMFEVALEREFKYRDEDGKLIDKEMGPVWEIAFRKTSDAAVIDKINKLDESVAGS